ncbi:MAG: HAD family hydrolase [Coriobacteriales bacterium]|nr:HAD family hydrolase [Coriobacteriales bacterium]
MVFDYDGTLHECLRIYKPALQKAWDYLVAIGYEEPRQLRDEDCARWLGINVWDMWAGLAPEAPDYIHDCCIRIVQGHMKELVERGEARLFPGVPEMLASLAADGYDMVVLSNCKHDYKELHLASFGLMRWLRGFYAAEDFGFAPKPQIFRAIEADFPGRRFVVAGDRYKDLEVAREFGLPSVGCLYGYGGREELADATVLVSDVRELEAALRELC